MQSDYALHIPKPVLLHHIFKRIRRKQVGSSEDEMFFPACFPNEKVFFPNGENIFPKRKWCILFDIIAECSKEQGICSSKFCLRDGVRVVSIGYNMMI